MKKLQRPKTKFKPALKCPFCGSGNLRVYQGIGDWVVQCMKVTCHSDGPTKSSRNKAIDGWNKALR